MATARPAGFRYTAAGSASTWHGVVRNGTSETTIDMGVGGSASVDGIWYARLGLRRLPDGSYEFYTVAYQEDPRIVPSVTIVGIIDTDHPDEGLRPVIGVTPTTTGTRGMLVDYYTIYGRTRR